MTTLDAAMLRTPYAHRTIKQDGKFTYAGCVWDPSLVITPSLSISICLNVLTFCRISSSVYLNGGRRDTTVSRGSALQIFLFSVGPVGQAGQER